MHGHNARVLEAGQHACFRAQTLRVCGIARHTRNLDRNLAVELTVERAIHGAHATLTDRLAELVAIAGQVRQRRDLRQSSERFVGKPAHAMSTPRISRASVRNSSSVLLTARN